MAETKLTLTFSAPLYSKLSKASDNRQITVPQLLQQFVRLGLMVFEAEAKPDASFVLREGENETRVTF